MRDLPDRPSLEYYRREAKELLRAHRGGDEAARDRVAGMLGVRGRFLLADAQLVLAREHGFRSWSDLRRAVGTSRLDVLQLLERGEVVVDSGPAGGRRLTSSGPSPARTCLASSLSSPTPAGRCTRR